MEAFLKVFYLAIDSENVDVLVALLQGVEELPEELEKAALSFFEKYAQKHGFGRPYLDLDELIEEYKKWNLEQIYTKSNFVSYLASADPNEEDLARVITFLKERPRSRFAPTNARLFGQISYWLFMYHRVYHPGKFIHDFYLTFSARQGKDFTHGFLEEARRNGNYEPVDELLYAYKEGSYGLRLSFNDKEYIEAHIERRFAQDQFKSYQILSSIMYNQTETIRLVLRLTSREDCVEETKRDIALDLNGLRLIGQDEYTPRIKNKTFLVMIEQPVDQTFWEYFIYFFVLRRTDLTSLDTLLAHQTVDPDFDPYRLERKEVREKIVLYL